MRHAGPFLHKSLRRTIDAITADRLRWSAASSYYTSWWGCESNGRPADWEEYSFLKNIFTFIYDPSKIPSSCQRHTIKTRKRVKVWFQKKTRIVALKRLTLKKNESIICYYICRFTVATKLWLQTTSNRMSSLIKMNYIIQHFNVINTIQPVNSKLLP